MGEHKSLRLHDHQHDALGEMVDDEEAGNESEALRRALDEGLRQLGYAGAANSGGQTTLQVVNREFARAFGWIGVGWLGVTWALPVGYRLGGVWALLAALGLVALDRVLDSYEPAISERLRGQHGDAT